MNSLDEVSDDETQATENVRPSIPEPSLPRALSGRQAINSSIRLLIAPTLWPPL